MKVSNQELERFANIIIQKIKDEFQVKHLSGNLVNTLEVVIADGNVQVVIPAKTYNMLKYFTQGVVVHTSHGSYASKLDTTGSEFYVYPKGTIKGKKRVAPHNHVGFVDKVIQEATQEWLTGLKNYKGKVTEL